MPVPRGVSQIVIDTILQGRAVEEVAEQLKTRLPEEVPMPPNLPHEARWNKEAQQARLAILSRQGITLEYVSGKKPIEDTSILEGNIENFIGMAQMPIGIVGPLRINGTSAHGDFYVPMATTEGALVASHNRGARVISLSGGTRVLCLTERVSRAPGFTFDNMIEAGKFLIWVVNRFDDLKIKVKDITKHGQLQDIKVTMEGNHVYLNFEYTTGDAAGQNMVTIATDVLCQSIVTECPVKPRHWFIESNMSGDKKATAMSYLFVRGKKVTAEVAIPRSIVIGFLHTTPEIIMEYWKMSFLGGVQSGSIGVQGHYANGLAALFIAAGQDAACVAEASVGMTRVDVIEKGDLYISVTLPNLIVGTIGGGTDLPTQKECLEMLGCKGEGSARKFAEICASTVLAGEISIMGALSAGQFTQAHIRYGRKRKKT